MTVVQRWIAYGLVCFIMVWGLDAVYALKMNIPITWKNTFSLLQLSQLCYCLFSILLCHVIWKRVLPPRRFRLILPSILLLLVSFIVFRYLVEEVLYPFLFQMRNYNGKVSYQYYFLDNIYYAIIYIVLGTMLFLLDNQILQQGKEAELKQRNREAELQFLRSQIHPHFLFNTLNNIYSLVYEKSDRAPRAMLQLSELMRYLLYEKKERVALAKEWSYIRHFIELQQLRFEKPVEVHEQIEGDLEAVEIAPYLIVPFVENAFKHADFKKGPLLLVLRAEKDTIELEISNPIGRLQKDESGGIGLENVRRRLQLLYPDRHELTSQAVNENFTVKMLIRDIVTEPVN